MCPIIFIDILIVHIEEIVRLMSEIIIYEEKGKILVDVLVEDATVWLSLNQLAELFERDKSVISRHLKNIFDSGELERVSTVAKNATVQIEGGKSVERKIDFYNLDAIISVGYRVNSKRGTQFRQWASRVLQKYLIEGYVLNQKKLLSKGLQELEQSFKLLSRTLCKQEKLSDVSKETIQIFHAYARSWELLLQYDAQNIEIPSSTNLNSTPLEYEYFVSCISDFKSELILKEEASNLFGIERESGLKAILGNLSQTFSSEPLYPTIEEIAAHLLYFVIKDHPFVDGNKRIGSFLFLLYLRMSQIPLAKINEVTMVALALLVADSDPSEKNLIIPLIMNLIQC